MKKSKKAEDIEVKAEVIQPKIKTKEFILKRPLNGKKAGEKVSLGIKGEQFYKSKKVI